MRSLSFSLALLTLVLTGCASQPVGMHQPSLENVLILRQSRIESLAVGDFKLSAAAPADVDQLVTVRGSRITSPIDDSYSAYLKESIRTELRAAGKYDETAACVLSGELHRNELNAAGVSKGTAALAATFSLARNGETIYETRHDIEHAWASSFIGAIAIPEAINQYTEMYTQLIKKLFEDPEFQKAAMRKGE